MFCCQAMEDQVNYRCDQHPDPYDCPDNLVNYIPKFDEYGIIVHDGGTACCSINYCPWCGIKLPPSRRDQWFEALESLGIDPSDTKKIPPLYLTNQWFKK